MTLRQRHHHAHHPATAAGQWICTLVEGEVASGYHEVMWDARNASGFNMASGTYFAVLKAGDLRQTRPMTLVR